METVNYYEHHLGDYAEATAHLSFVEDAAYSRCIRKYYTTEKPLPTEVSAVQRLVGARSKDEKAAVEAILKEFFTLDADGWHNRRCDEEIARYQDKQSKAKRSATARWAAKPADTERNANAMRTHSEGNALQSPVSSLQSPEKNLDGERAARAPTAKRLAESFELTPERQAIARAEAVNPEREFARFCDHWRAASGASARKHDWDAAWRNWCRKAAEFAPRGGAKADTPALTWRPPPDEEIENASG